VKQCLHHPYFIDIQSGESNESETTEIIDQFNKAKRQKVITIEEMKGKEEENRGKRRRLERLSILFW
jgi:hypothetical protein